MLAAIAFLNACSTPGDNKQGPETPTNEAQQLETQHEYPLNLPPSKFHSEFNRAEQSLFEFNWMPAEAIIATIPAEEISLMDQVYIHYIQARILYVQGKQTDAQNILQALDLSTNQPAMRYKILSFQRYIYNLAGDSLNSARVGDQLLQITPEGPMAKSLTRYIWRDLQQFQASSVQRVINENSTPRWQSWLALSELGTHQDSGADQLHALTLWRSNNPDHPAAEELPGGMGFLLGAEPNPKKVALLLPLSGRLAPAAQAVRDGYLANYYAARARDGFGTDVEVINLLDFDSVTQAYNSAVENGAELVIGPLSKNAVEELGKLPGRTVPVLALNRVDGSLPAAETALVQLALAPEDEVEQIAKLAFGRGARRALVIHPAGEWGDKMNAALGRQWQKLGGVVSSTATYSNRGSYSSSISSALNLRTSEQRANDIRRMLATKVESTARRRQDVDVVFLLSKNAVEARSLKPLLAYHYASDLPVYATSNIYRGITDPRDKDLEGIHLVETPWLLNKNLPIRQAMTAGGSGNFAYSRLNALGADAFLLQTRFAQLRAGQDMLIRGNTGLLTLTPELHIKRQLQSATFDGGNVTAQ
ncbi:MAG: outer membrane PBP1 activator LpoA protein [Halioglobus sp.]|jgi:outer membrane PBP1 activator LpoA protein